MSAPPFDPPYKARRLNDGAEQWVEVDEDGSETPTAAPTTAWHAIPDPGTTTTKTAAPAKSKPGVKVLTVPYAEKDEAKQLGAKWDATRKKWYVPQGVDPAPFRRWLLDDA